MAIQPQEMVNILNLTLGIEQVLIDNLADLLDEVNDLVADYPLVVPDLLFGVQIEMLQRPLKDLPVLAFGVYNRTTLEEGEQGFARVEYPFLMEVYLGSKVSREIYVQCGKWAILFCTLVQRYFSDIMPGYMAEQMPDVEVTYVLKKGDNSFRQMVICAGSFIAEE